MWRNAARTGIIIASGSTKVLCPVSFRRYAARAVCCNYCVYNNLSRATDVAVGVHQSLLMVHFTAGVRVAGLGGRGVGQPLYTRLLNYSNKTCCCIPRHSTPYPTNLREHVHSRAHNATSVSGTAEVAARSAARDQSYRAIS